MFEQAPYMRPDGNDAERNAYEFKMKDWREYAVEEASRTLRLSEEFDRIPEYIAYLQGEYWSRRRPNYLSKFFDNRIAQARYATLSLLTDIRPTIDVHSVVPEYNQQAQIIQNVIRHEWYKQDLDLSLVSVVDAAMLFGNGFWKMGAQMPGYMTFSPCGADVVMPIQPGFHIQDSSAVLYRTYKPLSYFQKLWPSRSANLEQEAVMADQQQGEVVNKPPHVSQFTWNSLSPQMKWRIGQKPGRVQTPTPQSYPIIELQEYWVEDLSLNESTSDVVVKDPFLTTEQHNYWYKVSPMGRLYPRKRLIVFAGKRLMYDGPSPYWHGKFPFAMLRLNPVMWSFWGLSKYRDLIPINKAVNEIGAGTLDAIKRALNPQMLTKEGGVPKEAWERFFPNMPGGKLRLGTMADVSKDVRYMDPPMLPSYVFQFLAQYLGPEFDRLGGFVDVGKIAGKKQVPGGESIEQMRDMANPYVRLEGRYIEAFLRDAGALAISNIFQFYTAKQRLRILGGDGITPEDFDFNPESMVPAEEIKEDHWRKFSLQVAPGSLLGTNKQQEQTAAMTLFRMGAISRKALLRKLQVPDANLIEKELVEEHQAGISGPGAGGRTPRQNREQRQGKPA